MARSFLAADGVPEAHAAVVAARREALPRRVERQAQHLALVAAQHLRLAEVAAADQDVVILAAAGQALAVGRKADGGDVVVSGQHHVRRRARVPDVDARS